MGKNLNKATLMTSLERISDFLGVMGKKAEFVIVGGSAFILKELVNRFTHDIDLINKVDEDLLEMLIDVLHLDINTRVANPRAYGKIFIGWEKEVETIHEFPNLKVSVLSDEMLVASKFFTKKFDRDITDMALAGNKVIKDKLEKLVINIIENGTSVQLNMLADREMEIIEFYKAQGWEWDESDIKKLLHN